MTAKSDLPSAAAPGTILGGKYRVERVLGRGGMGVVLLATHLELQKRVAVKLLLAKASPVVSSRFRREAQVAAQLASPHVAQVLDFGVSDDLPFLVMEYLEGHDLETELHQRRFIPIPEAIDLVLEGCVGIAQAHAAGLVHRDLKPANLFLSVARSGRRTVKVLDFGLIKDGSSEAQSLTASAEVFGTPQYMAPEQIQSSKNVDARCDQHALALVLFELCAGSPAYKAESLPHLIVVIATHPPPSLSAVMPGAPPGFAQVLTTALAKQPSQRFPHLGAFAAALVPFGGPRAAELCAEINASLAGVPVPAAPAAGTEVHASSSGTAMMPSPPSAAVMMRTEPSFNGSVPAMSRPLAGPSPLVEPKPRPSALLLVGIGASVLGLVVLVAVLAFVRRGADTIASTGVPTESRAPAAASASPAEPASPAAPSAESSAAPPEPAPSAVASPASSASSAPVGKKVPARPPATPAKPPPPRPPGTKCTGLSCY